MSTADPIALVDHLFRKQAGQMIATLTRSLGSRHLTLAEDAVQDALMTAMQQWPFRGIPDNPEAWLFQVARNRALDRLRHGRMAADKEPAIARESPPSNRRTPSRCCAASCRPSKTINSGCCSSPVIPRCRPTRAWRWR